MLTQAKQLLVAQTSQFNYQLSGTTVYEKCDAKGVCLEIRPRLIHTLHKNVRLVLQGI
jgi:hypothetical protein